MHPSSSLAPRISSLIARATRIAPRQPALAAKVFVVEVSKPLAAGVTLAWSARVPAPTLPKWWRMADRASTSPSYAPSVVFFDRKDDASRTSASTSQ